MKTTAKQSNLTRDTSGENPRIIADFLRFTDQGSVERVTWLKTGQGETKQFDVLKTPHKPSSAELKKMSLSSYGETSLLATA